MSEADEPEVYVAAIACPRCQTDMTDELSCDRCGWIEQNFGPLTGDLPPLASKDEKKPDGIAWKDKATGRGDIARGNYYLIAIGTCLIIGLLVSVITAMSSQSPGIAICFVVLALPPVIRTALVVWHRGKKGLSTSPLKRSKMFVSSLFVTAMVGTTLVVISILFTACAILFSLVSLLLFCFAKPQVYSPYDLAVTPTGWLLILIAVVPYVCWVIARWQKDTVAEDE